MFGNFGTGDCGERPQISARINLVRSGTDVRLTIDGACEDRRFCNEAEAFGFVYSKILDRVSRGHSNLLCLHAAALSRGGHGIAIAAPCAVIGDLLKNFRGRRQALCSQLGRFVYCDVVVQDYSRYIPQPKCLPRLETVSRRSIPFH